MDLSKLRFLEVARLYLKDWYTWGGDDPSGIDCSGLVVECLKSVGLIPLHSDYSAEGLWHLFEKRRAPGAQSGSLAFWFDSTGKATHVAICLDAVFCITADGGGRHVKTVEDAIKHNAFIKVRRIDHRDKEPKFINPFG